MFIKTNKLIQVYNNVKVSKLGQNFHFCVNYPFKFCKDNLFFFPFGDFIFLFGAVAICIWILQLQNALMKNKFKSNIPTSYLLQVIGFMEM